MTQVKTNTNSQKGTHLSFDERSQIYALKSEGYSNWGLVEPLNAIIKPLMTKLIGEQ